MIKKSMLEDKTAMCYGVAAIQQESIVSMVLRQVLRLLKTSGLKTGTAKMKDFALLN